MSSGPFNVLAGLHGCNHPAPGYAQQPCMFLSLEKARLWLILCARLQMLENAAEQGTRPEMDAAQLSRSRRLERLKLRSQRHMPQPAPGASAEAGAAGSDVAASFKSTMSIFGSSSSSSSSSSKRERTENKAGGWLSRVQVRLVAGPEWFTV